MNSHTTVQMSASGQVEIPPTLRAKLNWDGAMELDLELTSSGLLIHSKKRREKTRSLEELRGMLKHNGERIPDDQLHAPVDLEENA